MQFEVNRNTSDMGEPSLAEMTAKAIQILKKNKKEEVMAHRPNLALYFL
jgi:alkaline phosphatase